MEYVTQLLAGGNLASDGVYTKRCVELLESRFHIAKVLLTPSCTAALEMAAILCDLQPGDEVIMPSYTFVSTANAVMLRGAKPVFVDIRPDTLNLDESRIEEKISSRTKAIFVVHYAGVACEMDPILDIARRHNLRVIEDAAQALHSYYRGRPLGTLGDIGAYSFHYTKNFICGEGGAICINLPEFADRAEIIREKGTNRRQFLLGNVDKYTWVDVGSSQVGSEVSSALLCGQLEMLDEIHARRAAAYERYQQLLQPLELSGFFDLPRVPAHCQGNYHIMYLMLRSGDHRDRLLAHLRDQGISAVIHYVPLHGSAMGTQLGYSPGDFPVTERAGACLLRLPLFADITADQQERVVNQVARFFEQVV
ncbi:MAG: dTDP-4-amino-4,6-dideoxygalactose transaminase [Planctomycetales bacterium]|nr:dTDP-4-amino-4,6-dideoxygalactose transaminase [Planctomycetales bacterium]